MLKHADRLLTVRQDLAEVIREVSLSFPLAVLCGRRDQAAQDQAFVTGHSKVRWPNSEHNTNPSNAVDVAPHPIDFKDRDRFILLAGFVLATGLRHGLSIRWGGDWNGNLVVKDERFQDLGHFEIRRS